MVSTDKRPTGCNVVCSVYYLWWVRNGVPQGNGTYKHGGGPYKQQYSNGCDMDSTINGDYAWLCADCAAKDGIIW